MSDFIKNCSFCKLTSGVGVDKFECGDIDIDDFFAEDCFNYSKQLLCKNYCCISDEYPSKIISAFSLANASIKVDNLPGSRRRKLEHNIPHLKSLKEYPAVLVGRLGVSSDFHSMRIGSAVLDFVKYWFVEPNNKTGCRFVIFDAYNKPETLKFYEYNGFKTVFSTNEQEMEYHGLSHESHLNTRLMFFDLLSVVPQ